eukprot:403332683
MKKRTKNNDILLPSFNNKQRIIKETKTPIPQMESQQYLHGQSQSPRTENKKVKDNTLIKWLRQRYPHRAKESYLYREQELNRCNDIIAIFDKFDADKSGYIEINELYQMFKQNDILITKQQLTKLFKAVDSNQSNTLSVQEFKRFILSEENKMHFRNIMRQVKKNTKVNEFNNGIIASMKQNYAYVPLTFEALMNHFNTKGQRDQMREKIHQPKKQIISQLEAKQDLKNFIELFKCYDIDASELQDGTSKSVSQKLLQIKSSSSNLGIYYSRSPDQRHTDTPQKFQLNLSKINIIEASNMPTSQQQQDKQSQSEVKSSKEFLSSKGRESSKFWIKNLTRILYRQIQNMKRKSLYLKIIYQKPDQVSTLTL